MVSMPPDEEVEEIGVGETWVLSLNTGTPWRYSQFGFLDHRNKVNISINWDKWIFLFPHAYKSYVYTIYSVLSV